MLDTSLRSSLRAEVARVLSDAATTAILVTHDQEEALSMADRVVVLRDGRVVQDATPTEVYRSPADEWVAGFVGDAVLLDGELLGHGGGGARVRCVLGDLDVDVARNGPSRVGGSGCSCDRSRCGGISPATAARSGRRRSAGCVGSASPARRWW